MTREELFRSAFEHMVQDPRYHEAVGQIMAVIHDGHVLEGAKVKILVSIEGNSSVNGEILSHMVRSDI